ncbi:MAG: ectonucleotide pyrophosphatase/phosphodiesterase [Acidobacteriota bacterium]
MLVSIDGLRPEFYLDRTWPAPMLQQMAAEGAHARAVETVFPSVTYPSHTSMVTGVRPARHGIHYNAPFEPGGVSGRWYWHANAITAPTLWSSVAATGGTSAAIGWPVTVGATIDWNIPEIWSLDPAISHVEAMRRASTPDSLFAEIEREATGRLRDDNFTIDHMRRDTKAAEAAAHILETHRPTLLLVHLIATDHFQHEDGREGPRVRRAVAVADRALSQLVEAAERTGIQDRTAFVVTGDHGHVTRHTKVAPNIWLAADGFVEPTADRGSWRAVFHTTGSAAFLHLRDPADSETLDRVRALLAARPSSERALFTVLERDALAALGAAPEAALGLAMHPGIDATSAVDGPALRPTSGATHGYLPGSSPDLATGLVAWGAGVVPGARASRLSLVDIAPLVGALLGLDFERQADTEGIAPRGWLRTATADADD